MPLYERVIRRRGSGDYLKGRAGEGLGRGQLVYKNPNGAWYRADADATATTPVIGITLESAVTGQIVRILTEGYIGANTWMWTTGGDIYASQIPGVLTQTAPILPAIRQWVGMATSPTMIYFTSTPPSRGVTIGCPILEGDTAYVGFDTCKEPYANYFLCDGVADNVQIQDAIDYLPADGGSVLLENGTFNVATAVPITIPSNTALEGLGRDITIIKRVGVPVGGHNMIRSDPFTLVGAIGGEATNIIIRNLTIDGTQNAFVNNTHSVYLTSVKGLIIENVSVIDSSNFAVCLYRCEDVFVEDMYIEDSSAAVGVDGLHLWDTRKAVILGIRGSSGDDLMVVRTVDFDIDEVYIAGVVGSSQAANVLRLAVGVGTTIEGVVVEGVIVEDAGAHGVTLADIVGVLQDTRITDVVVLASALSAMSISGAGSATRLHIGATLIGPASSAGGNLDASAAITESVFDLLVYNVRDNNAGVYFADASRCEIKLRGDYVNAGKVTPQQFLWLADGDGNLITDGYHRGGLRSIQIGNGATTPTYNRVTNNVFDGATQNVIRETGNADYNTYRENTFLNSPPTPVVLVGANTIVPEIFSGAFDPLTTLGDHPVVTMADAVTTNVYNRINLPLDFQVLVSAEVIVCETTVVTWAQVMRWQIDTDFGKICAGENYNQHSDNVGATDTILDVNQLECLDISAALTGIAAGDLIGFNFARIGGHINDTVAGSVYYMGIRLRYV